MMISCVWVLARGCGMVMWVGGLEHTEAARIAYRSHDILTPVRRKLYRSHNIIIIYTIIGSNTHVEGPFDQRSGLADVQRGRRVEQQLHRIPDHHHGLRFQTPAEQPHVLPGHLQAQPYVLPDLPRNRKRGQDVRRRRVFVHVRVQEAHVHRARRRRYDLHAQLHHLQKNVDATIRDGGRGQRKKVLDFIVFIVIKGHPESARSGRYDSIVVVIYCIVF